MQSFQLETFLCQLSSWDIHLCSTYSVKLRHLIETCTLQPSTLYTFQLTHSQLSNTFGKKKLVPVHTSEMVTPLFDFIHIGQLVYKEACVTKSISRSGSLKH